MSKKKKIYYFILQEHKDKIDGSEFDNETCYRLLTLFANPKFNSKYNRYTEVPARAFKSIAGNKYTDYISFFVKNKMIHIDNTYIVNYKARGYKLREENKSKVLKIEAKDKKFIDEMKKVFKRDKDKVRSLKLNIKPMRPKFKEFMNCLDIDKIKELAQELDGPNTRVNQVRLIDRIENNRFYFSRNKTNNRLDSNLTNLKTEFKYYLKEGNYVQIDIKNSQPFFLSLVLNRVAGLSNNTNFDEIFEDKDLSYNFYDVTDEFIEEVKTFTKYVKNGIFYDELIGIIGRDRPTVKKKIMEILFSKVYQFPQAKKRFAIKYPKIIEFIEQYKEHNGYQQFAIMLQKAESKMVLDIISKQMVDNDIIPVTIHDSWIVDSKDKYNAIAIIEEHIDANLSVEELKPPQESTETLNEGSNSEDKEKKVDDTTQKKEAPEKSNKVVIFKGGKIILNDDEFNKINLLSKEKKHILVEQLIEENFKYLLNLYYEQENE